MKKVNFLITTLITSVISYASNSFGSTGHYQSIKIERNAIQEKEIKEKSNSFISITPYKYSYFFPVNYTTKPFKSVYRNENINDKNIRPLEAKFQFSFKVPVFQNMLNDSGNLYIAYTQSSFWQAYNHIGFVRETNYEPEIFLANSFHINSFPGWKFNFLNIGFSHQSNGKGGTLERAWDRVYLEGIFSNENLVVSLKPWHPIHQASMRDYNSDIAKYLGYGRLLIEWKNDNNQVLSLKLRNIIESHFKRGAVQVDWSFPLNKHLSGYIQFFSGYGQNLIEYNHYTNSVGIGISLNRWL